MTAPAPRQPQEYTYGLGEIIRSHRLYTGLSQRAMADRLEKDRRDYQRIENGRDACPPGLLTTVEQMTDSFDQQVDAVIEAARRNGGVDIAIDTSPRWEWERNVAGRAALLCSGGIEDAPRITLTLAGKSPERSTA